MYANMNKVAIRGPCFRLSLAVVALAACSSHTSAHAPQTTTSAKPACAPSLAAGLHKFPWKGMQRTYRLALPTNDGARHPLVLVLHGFASSSAQFDRETNFPALGTERGDIVLTPNASGSPTNWNIFNAPNQPDDYGFVHTLLAAVVPQTCVDRARVYVAGHSAGSAFAGFFACRPPYPFAAVAMVSATVRSTCPATVTPAVISVHGTADPVVPYAGGLGIGQTVPIPPVRQTDALLARQRHCAPQPIDDHVAPHVARRRYLGCAHGDDVELLTLEGGGHLWAPGTTARILDFFAAHSQR
jgi:polyhydroxybutyrate depolymerase